MPKFVQMSYVNGTPREKIVRELKRLQSENDILVGKHSARSEEMAADAINLPEGAEEMQLMLLKLREDLIAAKVISGGRIFGSEIVLPTSLLGWGKCP